MEFKEAIAIIEDRADLEKLQPIRDALSKRLNDLPEVETEERGLAYYYLLRVLLKTHMYFESEEAASLYGKMTAAFSQTEAKKASKEFYRLMERIYSSLEVIYDKKDFLEARRRAYERKMDYRKAAAWHSKKLWTWFELAFLRATSRYGDSFIRWGATGLIFAFICAILYYAIDHNLPEALRMSANLTFGDYLYFSIVTFTTLGLGDIVPHFWLSRVVAGTEVFFGFVLLGMFVGLLQKKL